MEWLWECSLFFSLLKEFKKDWYKFFTVCLVEFPSCLFGFVLFSSLWLWLDICQFCRKQLLVLLIFSITLDYYLFPLWFLLFPSFSWLWAFLLFFFFIVFLSGRLGYLRYFCFFKKICIALNSPFGICFTASHRFCKVGDFMIFSSILSLTYYFFNGILCVIIFPFFE